MKNFTALAVLLTNVSIALFGVGEKTLNISGASAWKLERAVDVIELKGIRPNSVLSLVSSGSAGGAMEKNLDLYLSFDEGEPVRFRDSAGNYSLLIGESLQNVERRWARKGAGAALFSGAHSVSWRSAGNEPLTFKAKNTNALFYAGRNLSDFSIEFFLYPANMESGEEIFDWTATAGRSEGMNANKLQYIRAVVAKNRIHWQFENFFCSTDSEVSSKNITLSSMTALTPSRWSHHLIRFEAGTGLLEYLVDGNIEAVTYATSSGMERGEVLTPVIGERGRFAIGRQFNGFVDELKVSGAFETSSVANRYAAKGGKIETSPFELGASGGELRKIDVTGGVLRISGKNLENNYTRGGAFLFQDGAQLQFFVRTAETSYSLSKSEWAPFKSGAELHGLKGRFAQIRADFYPSGDLESAPYIESFNVEFLVKKPPKPPVRLSALARDGSVELSWKEEDSGAAGYIVYYGVRPGEYFGTGAGRGESPVDVGKQSSVKLDSLKNGVLYYFAVAAYDDSGPKNPGEFSREVSARPLRMLE
ncbi:MAG: hypothetical protein Pg6A_03320 [Termitinemataceae bacterium]|nr:MAG: hypothetical protein Pg6A_03320 [Termitinemataceae bacterium]